MNENIKKKIVQVESISETQHVLNCACCEGSGKHHYKFNHNNHRIICEVCGGIGAAPLTDDWEIIR